MNELDLIFSMLGEAAITEITKIDDAKGFYENKIAAHKGGEVAGKAIKDHEGKTGEWVLSKENCLITPQSQKKLEKK